MVDLHDGAINSEREGQIDTVGWLLVAFAVVVALHGVPTKPVVGERKRLGL